MWTAVSSLQVSFWPLIKKPRSGVSSWATQSQAYDKPNPAPNTTALVELVFVGAPRGAVPVPLGLRDRPPVRLARLSGRRGSDVSAVAARGITRRTRGVPRRAWPDVLAPSSRKVKNRKVFLQFTQPRVELYHQIFANDDLHLTTT